MADSAELWTTVLKVLVGLIALIFLREIYARKATPTDEPFIGNGLLMMRPVGALRGRFYWAMRTGMLEQVLSRISDQFQLTAEEKRRLSSVELKYRYAIVETMPRQAPGLSTFLPSKTLLFSSVELTTPPNAFIERQSWYLPTFEKKPEFCVSGAGFNLGIIEGWNVLVCRSVYSAEAGGEKDILNAEQIRALEAFTGVYAKLRTLTTVEHVQELEADNSDLKARIDVLQSKLTEANGKARKWEIAARNRDLPGSGEEFTAGTPFLSAALMRLIGVALLGAAVGYFMFPQVLPQYFNAREPQTGAIAGGMLFAAVYYVLSRRRG